MFITGGWREPAQLLGTAGFASFNRRLDDATVVRTFRQDGSFSERAWGQSEATHHADIFEERGYDLAGLAASSSRKRSAASSSQH